MFSSIRRFFFGKSKKEVLQDILSIAYEAEFGYSYREGLRNIIEYCEDKLGEEEIEDSVCG